jgi:hypothetical protein
MKKLNCFESASNEGLTRSGNIRTTRLTYINWLPGEDCRFPFQVDILECHNTYTDVEFTIKLRDAITGEPLKFSPDVVVPPRSRVQVVPFQLSTQYQPETTVIYTQTGGPL